MLNEYEGLLRLKEMLESEIGVYGVMDRSDYKRRSKTRDNMSTLIEVLISSAYNMGFHDGITNKEES